MPLMPFSEPTHIKLLLDGRKRQTTRKPRKRPLKVGDVLYCWYRPRMAKWCNNCIQIDCEGWSLCSDHKNKFGNATITAITTTKIYPLSIEEIELWALKDGFNSYRQAASWFEKHYGLDWEHIEWTIIEFDPDWIKPTCLNCIVYQEFKDDPDITCMDDTVDLVGCSSHQAASTPED